MSLCTFDKFVNIPNCQFVCNMKLKKKIYAEYITKVEYMCWNYFQKGDNKVRFTSLCWTLDHTISLCSLG